VKLEVLEEPAAERSEGGWDVRGRGKGGENRRGSIRRYAPRSAPREVRRYAPRKRNALGRRERRKRERRRRSSRWGRGGED
jgi:hypothetical protein